MTSKCVFDVMIFGLLGFSFVLAELETPVVSDL